MNDTLTTIGPIKTLSTALLGFHAFRNPFAIANLTLKRPKSWINTESSWLADYSVELIKNLVM